jgi:hypothetical protein
VGRTNFRWSLPPRECNAAAAGCRTSASLRTRVLKPAVKNLAAQSPQSSQAARRLVHTTTPAAHASVVEFLPVVTITIPVIL